MSIKVFFHICAITRAEEVVNRMINQIYFSGLYDEAYSIYCYISGDNEIIIKIKNILCVAGSKFTIVKCVPNDTSYERLTLEDIHNHIDKTDKILYIHSKGVSYQYKYIFHEGIDDWTNSMMYFLVRHYRKCIEKLENYDTVGTNYLSGSYPSHWSGNFWWVRGDYFLTLPHIIGPNYHDPELQFLFLNNPSYYEIHNKNKFYDIDCYYHRYEPFKYIDHKLE
jgi:hypothetical protein